MSTPIALIVEAYEGRLDMLKAIFGGADGSGRPGRQRKTGARKSDRRRVNDGLNAFFSAHGAGSAGSKT